MRIRYLFTGLRAVFVALFVTFVFAGLLGIDVLALMLDDGGR